MRTGAAHMPGGTSRRWSAARGDAPPSRSLPQPDSRPAVCTSALLPHDAPAIGVTPGPTAAPPRWHSALRARPAHRLLLPRPARPPQHLPGIRLVVRRPGQQHLETDAVDRATRRPRASPDPYAGTAARRAPRRHSAATGRSARAAAGRRGTARTPARRPSRSPASHSPVHAASSAARSVWGSSSAPRPATILAKPSLACRRAATSSSSSVLKRYVVEPSGTSASAAAVPWLSPAMPFAPTTRIAASMIRCRRSGS
ncbi:hypothetical protein SVIOM74S_03917 [Streptomyces violarus]